MSKYHTDQIDKILNENDEFYIMKLTSANNETNWMNVSPANLKKIKAIMRSQK